jgi:NTP pyrophosphatase (non-canonical NTP hydrolase)
VELGELQKRLDTLYGERDRARGRDATFAWFVEEVGELSRALRRGEKENLREEFSDTLAWLVSLATLAGVDVADAAKRYEVHCPRCVQSPCACPMRREER